MLEFQWAKIQIRGVLTVGNLAAPESPSASLVLSGIMSDEWLDHEADTARLMEKILQRSRGMDEMDRETLIARVQRGLPSARFVRGREG